MAEDDDANEVDLGISLESVATVVDQLRALQIGGPGSAAGEDTDVEGDDDEAEEMLEAFITEMSADEQVSLIALALVGRGDFSPDEWADARRLAAEGDAGRDAATDLLAMDNLADLLSEGVAAFGLSLEDVER